MEMTGRAAVMNQFVEIYKRLTSRSPTVGQHEGFKKQLRELFTKQGFAITPAVTDAPNSIDPENPNYQAALLVASELLNHPVQRLSLSNGLAERRGVVVAFNHLGHVLLVQDEHTPNQTWRLPGGVGKAGEYLKEIPTRCMLADTGYPPASKLDIWPLELLETTDDYSLECGLQILVQPAVMYFAEGQEGLCRPQRPGARLAWAEVSELGLRDESRYPWYNYAIDDAALNAAMNHAYHEGKAAQFGWPSD